MVCVDKGEWDKGGTPEYIDSFNRAWISECQNKTEGKMEQYGLAVHIIIFFQQPIS